MPNLTNMKQKEKMEKELFKNYKRYYFSQAAVE